MTRRALDEFRDATSSLPDETVARVRESVRGHSSGSPAWRWAALGAVVAIGLVALWPRQPRSGLAVITEHQSREISLVHDGHAVIAADSSAVISDADGNGAEIALERGTVSLSVHQAPGARYVVRHRAYSVEAVGTKFSVTASTSGAPRVIVTEGVVILRGPGLRAEGERLSPEVPSPVIEREVDAGHVRTSQAASSWLPLFRELVANGDSVRATALIPASAPGNCSGCTAKDAVDLADLLAANGENDRADRAYARSCEIEQASAACAVAMVRLALQAEAEGRREEAIRWATKSLQSNPRGTFATELTLRRMKWRWASGATEQAKEDAQRIVDDPSLNATQRAEVKRIVEAP